MKYTQIKTQCQLPVSTDIVLAMRESVKNSLQVTAYNPVHSWTNRLNTCEYCLSLSYRYVSDTPQNSTQNILLCFRTTVGIVLRSLQEFMFENVCKDVLYLTYLLLKHLILQQLIYISARLFPNPQFASNILTILEDTVKPEMKISVITIYSNILMIQQLSWKIITLAKFLLCIPV